jgi:hypothetical protein
LLGGKAKAGGVNCIGNRAHRIARRDACRHGACHRRGRQGRGHQRERLPRDHQRRT